MNNIAAKTIKKMERYIKRQEKYLQKLQDRYSNVSEIRKDFLRTEIQITNYWKKCIEKQMEAK